ncbi:ribosome-binding factor A [Candidatus Saccharibacteria bacterium]|nr:ribosome-binding factor A [Candidatus Saccharibacteria bacterium]
MSRRTEQIAHSIQRIVAATLERAIEGETIVTVTRVDVAPDMKTAKVFVANWDNLTADLQNKGLRESQQAVRNGLTSKYTPRLTIIHDDASEYAAHIASLLKS